MKIQKTTQPATFQPIEFKITIESQTELECLNELYMQSSYIHTACITNVDEVSDEAIDFLEHLLDNIGEALYKAPEGT